MLMDTFTEYNEEIILTQETINNLLDKSTGIMFRVEVITEELGSVNSVQIPDICTLDFKIGLVVDLAYTVDILTEN